MINRKRYFNAGDIDISHDAGSGYIKDFVIFLDFFFAEAEAPGRHSQALIKGLCLCPHAVKIFRVHICDRSCISRDSPRLMEGVPPVTEGRIYQKTDADQQDQDQDRVTNLSSHLCPVYFMKTESRRRSL